MKEFSEREIAFYLVIMLSEHNVLIKCQYLAMIIIRLLIKRIDRSIINTNIHNQANSALKIDHFCLIFFLLTPKSASNESL